MARKNKDNPPPQDFALDSLDDAATDAGGDEAHVYFDTGKGNFLQFVGIVILTMGIPFLLFENSRWVGLIVCPIGAALYGVGRFANWYFWYRLQ